MNDYKFVFPTNQPHDSGDPSQEFYNLLSSIFSFFKCYRQFKKKCPFAVTFFFLGKREEKSDLKTRNNNHMIRHMPVPARDVRAVTSLLVRGYDSLYSSSVFLVS